MFLEEHLFLKKVFLEVSQNSQENTCAKDSFNARNFIKKESLAQVFSCEFCENSKNTFFIEQLATTASVMRSWTFVTGEKIIKDMK